MSIDSYSAWNVSEWDFPKVGSIESKIKYFSQYGLLAANLHNTQPWRFRIIKNELQIIPNLKYHLQRVDPTKKYLYISLGCCVKNIEVIAAHHEYDTVIKLSSGNIISLFFKKNSKKSQIADLASFITKRYSNKMPYANVPIKKMHLDELKKTLISSPFKLIFNDNKGIIRKVGA